MEKDVAKITPPNPALSVKQPDDPFGAAFGGDGAFWIVRAGGAPGLARLTPTGVPGSTFQCRLIKPATGKKKKKPKATFVDCGSPKVLKLGPGTYRFAVRAVANGAIDGSPVESAFKVVRAPRHR